MSSDLCCLRWASRPWRGKISGVVSGLCCYSSTIFCLKLCRKAQHEVNLWGAEMWGAAVVTGGSGHPRPVIMRTIIQLYVPRTLELDPGLRSPRRGIPNSQFENWCSKYWLLFPKVLSTMDYPGLTLSYSASDRWLNLLFVFLSPINDPGISRVTRLKEYRKCRTRYNAAQWIKVDERFIHGNLWLMAKVVYSIFTS